MTIEDGILAFTILIESCIGVRITILVFSMIQADESDIKSIKQRIKNCIVFMIIILCFASLSNVLKHYYGL